jgi:5-methylcytosine-specific restriction endonuclease McrA
MRKRKKGKHTEYHDDVYRRDQWKCQMPECLCPDGLDLNPDLRYTHDEWAPSVDHVVLLSQGGKDHKDNMRAAHRRCNQQDANFTLHARYGEQAPLTSKIGELFPNLATLEVDKPAS